MNDLVALQRVRVVPRGGKLQLITVEVAGWVGSPDTRFASGVRSLVPDPTADTVPGAVSSSTNSVAAPVMVWTLIGPGRTTAAYLAAEPGASRAFSTLQHCNVPQLYGTARHWMLGSATRKV